MPCEPRDSRSRLGLPFFRQTIQVRVPLLGHAIPLIHTCCHSVASLPGAIEVHHLWLEIFFAAVQEKSFQPY
jgi:hypothetical protein